MENPADFGELHIFLWHQHEVDICGFESQVSTTVGWITDIFFFYTHLCPNTNKNSFDYPHPPVGFVQFFN